MKPLPLFLTAILAMLLISFGCKKTDPVALVGAWAGERDHAKVAFDFSSDGKVFMLVGNDFGVGGVQGTYIIHGDHVTLSLQGAPVQDVAFEKPSSSKLRLTFPEDGTPIEFTLVGPGGMLDQSAAASSEAAQATTCLSNIKQLATATSMYEEDYDGFLPSANNWNDSLEPYTKTPALFDCPAIRKAGGKGGFAMDSRVASTSLKSHPKPQDEVLYFESETLGRNVSDPQTSLLTKPRHDKKMSFAYLDGHVDGGRR